MARVLLVLFTVVMCLPMSSRAQDTASAKEQPEPSDDPVQASLNAARAAYEKSMKEYRDAVMLWFEKRDEAARNLKSGVTEKVKQVAAEKKEFEDKGVLPKRIPRRNPE